MRLILIFIVVPLIEILLLIEIGSRIGALNTIFIIILTGILGGYMMRQQGFTIIRNIREDLSQGRMPTGELINGTLVLVGGIVLLTPGFFTDALGFILLIPATRRFILKRIQILIQRKIESGDIHIFFR
ncbi:MAG: FxsA family protein [Syntrophobacterales bacterium]|nr:MAG: FxsA family protein [Syntrophobacterales bacterium]